MRRIVLAAVMTTALTVPTFGLASAMPAGAATKPPSCGKLTGSISSTFTVSSCKPASASYKSASAPSSALATGAGTLTWSSSKKTTTVSIKITQAGKGCATGSTEYQASGTVTGGTATLTTKGQAVSAYVCVSATGALSLVPKSRMNL